MKNSYKLSLAAVAASISLVGCGGGTSADADLGGGTGGGTLVSVSNAPIYNATVTDADGQLAYQVPGTYQYKFASTPRYPISASGGWMDVNLNETFDAGTDVNLGYTMTSYSTTITPVTTYIADANETIREARLQELSDEFNISTEILLDIPVELAVSEEATRLAVLASSLTEEQVVSGSMDLTAVSTSFNDTVSNYTFDNTDMTAFITELEATVITPLVTSGDLTVADASSDVPTVVAAVEGKALDIAISSTDVQRVFFGRNRMVHMYDTNTQASDWRDTYCDWSYDKSTGNILIHMAPNETVTLHFDVLPVISGSSVTQIGKGSVTIPGEGTMPFTVENGYVTGFGDNGNFDFDARTLEGTSLGAFAQSDSIYNFVREIRFTNATEAGVTIVGDQGGTFDATVGWELINGNIVRIDTRDGSYVYLEILNNDAFEVNVKAYESGEEGVHLDAPVYTGFGMFNTIDTTTSTTTSALTLEITEAILSGKTFYEYDYETDQNNVKINDIYGKMTLANGVLTRTEIYVDVNTQQQTVDGPFTLDYIIVGGKIKLDLTPFGEGYGQFTLNSESTNAWDLTMEDDRNQDGVIDTGSARTTTWYLSKPVSYPDSL